MKIRSGLILFVSVVANVACSGPASGDGGLSDGTVEDASLPGIDTPNGVDTPTQLADVSGCMADGSSCGSGCANCGAGCVNIQSDNMNCGGCGTTCGAGRSCQGGSCVCAPGNVMCGAQCVSTMTDPMNCGMCGRACPMGQTCITGACQLNCVMPSALCTINGVTSCVNVESDPMNCGGCGTACMIPNANAVCGMGRCALGTCQQGFGNCDRQAGNGCEINTNTDVANCGGCDNRCPSLLNTTPACANGLCGVGACARGFGNCDGAAANGCEASLDTDNTNCGGCRNVCPMGQACVAGACQIRPGPAYSPVGPQQNVPVATVLNGGWTQCHLEAYNALTLLANIQASCNRGNVMVACRTVNNPTLQLLAQAPRADVFFDTGNERVNRFNIHNANGSAWYYSNLWSMGFARQGDVVNRFICDYPDAIDAPGSTLNPELRLCIHTANNQTTPGYRCGADREIYGATFERVFYHAN